MKKIRLELDDGPIFLQIVKQVKAMVTEGELPPRKELPSIRALAEDLQINPNTVAKAYRILAEDGIVGQRGRSGTFVSANLRPLSSSSGDFERLNTLIEHIDALRSEAKKVGARLQDVICILFERW